MTKPISDLYVSEVTAHRYRCCDCGGTFRHYPQGVDRHDQSHRLRGLAALSWALGLSLRSVSHLLGALGCDLSRMSVWRDVQESGSNALDIWMSGHRSRVRLMGADETVVKVRGKQMVVGFVTDAESGQLVGMDVLVDRSSDGFVGWLQGYVSRFGVESMVTDDLKLPRKQRHTAKRIYDRLRDEYDFDGGYTMVKDYVRERRLRTREMFVPLSHPPGHAQCDFGEAWAVIGGVNRKVHFFVLDLPHSDAMFVRAYPAETTEAFCDGHVSAFSFLGGVPQSVLYDNTKLAVARILGDGRRQRTRVFTELQSHYLFSDRFGRPGKGNDKGKVEGMVGYTRRNFLVPMPSFDSFDALNAHLEERCLERMEARLRGHAETIGERMVRDLDALLPLPAVPYDPSDRHLTRVSSLPLVRYRTNDYSVPVAYGHRDVLVRGYVDWVVISCGADVIARHRRSYERDDFVFDPVHYLPLLEHKTGALDQAAPLVGWDLPEEFGTLRRLLETRMGRRGKREFVKVLRLMEVFSQHDVHSAIRDAIRLGAVSFDAVKHLVLCGIEGRPPRLDLDLYPHLPRVNVSTTTTTDYMTLLSGRAS